MKKTQNNIFIKYISIFMAMCLVSLFNTETMAAPRTTARGTPAATGARKPTTPVAKTAVVVEKTVEKTVTEAEPEKEEFVIINKEDQFSTTLNEMSSSSSSASSNDLADKIRQQRMAFDARESADAVADSQRAALASGKNACDTGLRNCMMETCGSDFTKCALDGDTIFGDKLNKCRRDITCSGEEFSLFTAEIKADRDMNVKLSSYTKVVDCGNKYNSCIVNECGETYGKCLGKAAADKAIQKCSTIAKECTEQDSGLASRFGTVIGLLRGNAEKDAKEDEERLYKLRESMQSACKKIGAMFDERSFDCVYTVNFFAGSNQTTPMASRKRYAGDTFVCMQEWFGTNVTTYKENAYRETRAQTAASSAMLGSGVGTAVGLVSSGAIGRAVETQKAKKAVDEERILQGKPTLKEEEQARKEEIKEKKQEAKEAKKQAQEDKKEANKKKQEEAQKAKAEKKATNSKK